MKYEILFHTRIIRSGTKDKRKNVILLRVLDRNNRLYFIVLSYELRSDGSICHQKKILKQHNIQISMNGKGISINNVLIGRFFRTLQYNCIFITEFNSIKEFKEVLPRH